VRGRWRMDTYTFEAVVFTPRVWMSAGSRRMDTYTFEAVVITPRVRLSASWLGDGMDTRLRVTFDAFFFVENGKDEESWLLLFCL
jgi:hypothetical protein